MNISDQNFYKEVVDLLKELKDKPESFWGTLSDEQLDFCLKLLLFAQPQNNSSSAHLLSKDQLPKIRELTEAAKNYQNTYIGSLTARVWNLFTSQYAYMSQSFSDDYLGQTLDDFEAIVKYLETVKPTTQSSDSINPDWNDRSLDINDLPEELIPLIVSQMDTVTAKSFGMTSKKNLKKFQGLPNFQYLGDSSKELQQLKRAYGELKITSVRPDIPEDIPYVYKNDSRFQALFQTIMRSEKSLDSGKFKFSLDEAILLMEALALLDQHNFWKATIEDRTFLPQASDLTTFISEAKHKMPKISAHSEELSKIKILTLETSEVLEEIKYCTSLVTLNLEALLTRQLPEFLGDLEKLENLKVTSFYSIEFPPAKNKFPALKSLMIKPVSLNFIIDLPILEEIEFFGDPKKLLSVEVIEKLKDSKIRFKPLTLLNDDRIQLLAESRAKRQEIMNITQMMEMRAGLAAIEIVILKSRLMTVLKEPIPPINRSTKEKLLAEEQKAISWIQANRKKVKEVLKNDPRLLHLFLSQKFLPDSLREIAEDIDLKLDQ